MKTLFVDASYRFRLNLSGTVARPEWWVRLREVAPAQGLYAFDLVMDVSEITLARMLFLEPDETGDELLIRWLPQEPLYLPNGTAISVLGGRGVGALLGSPPRSGAHGEWTATRVGVKPRFREGAICDATSWSLGLS